MLTGLAVRNLSRNRRRSLLTAGGTAVGTILIVFTIAQFDGMSVEMVRGATAVQLGQVQIHHPEFIDKGTIYYNLPQDEGLLADVLAIDGVESLVPRCRLFGLVGHEQRSEIVQIVGTDPNRERETTLVVDGLIDGRWLSAEPADYPAPREVVVGTKMAEFLQVSVGDEMALLLQAADGSLGNDLVQIVGIVRTGNNMVDRQSMYMHLADVQYLAVLDGRIHEVSLRITNYDRAPEVALQVAGIFSPTPELDSDTPVVRPWQEIVPEVTTLVQFNDAVNFMMLFIVYGIVALALLNAQRMSALERRREFGVMMAIGVSPKRLFRIIEIETVFLTVAGALVGVLIGSLINLYFARYGLDLSMLSEEGTFNMAGVSFTGRLYFHLSTRMVTMPLVSVTIVSLVCGLWPAIQSARLDITRAIAGRS